MKKSYKEYEIVVITRESFPIGMAGTNRIISYLKPFCERSILAKVYITRPTGRSYNVQNKGIKGIFEGIHYEYATNTPKWPLDASKLKKIHLIVSGYYYTFAWLIKDRPAVIITYTSDFFTKLFLLFFQYFLTYRLIIEETEYPKILKITKNRFLQKLHLSLYKLADGMLVITPVLGTYYKELGVKNVFVLPISVDISHFPLDSGSINKQKYFTYVGGSGGFNRDGVFDIIKAFELFSQEKSDFKLLIVGPIDETNKTTQDIFQYIKNRSLSEKIIFTGSKSSEEIPKILMEATGIVMAPPKDFESGGFPFKLGEFLASGTPTICTKVSNVTAYLDESNSFLTEPGDIIGISKAMKQIVADLEMSANIGSKGRELAISKFDAKTYSYDLFNFLTNVSF